MNPADFKPLQELTFDPATHVYKLDGIVIPNVTSIMKPLSDAHYGGIDGAVLEKAADRGTSVHSAIDNYNEYGIVDIEPENEGYFNAYLAWASDYNVEPIATETRTYHKLLRYAGTLDMSCKERGEITLADFKTSSIVVPMLVGVQLEAYNRALESHGIKHDNRIIIQLKSNGTYRRYTEQDFPPRTECWKVFGSLLNVTGFIQKYK